MLASLKAFVASVVLLSAAAFVSAAQPERSVIDGSRPAAQPADVEPACGTAVAGTASAPCADSCAANCCAANPCCRPKCHKHLKHSRLSCNNACGSNTGACGEQACGSDSCSNDACGNDACGEGNCGTGCGKQHGCWLHGSKGGCGKHGCGHGHGCHNCNGYHQGRFQTRCNMIPHVAYINPTASYYYFRPYQAFHVREQQNEVISYGADPRQPYANLLFRTLYTELEAAWAEEDGKNGSPFEDEAPGEDAPAVEPPPARPAAPDFNTSAAPVQREQLAVNPMRTQRPVVSTAALPLDSARGVFRSRQ